MLHDDIIYLNFIYIAILADEIDDLYNHRILINHAYYRKLIEAIYHYKYNKRSFLQFKHKLHLKRHINHLEHRAIKKLTET